MPRGVEAGPHRQHRIGRPPGRDTRLGRPAIDQELQRFQGLLPVQALQHPVHARTGPTAGGHRRDRKLPSPRFRRNPVRRRHGSRHASRDQAGEGAYSRFRPRRVPRRSSIWRHRPKWRQRAEAISPSAGPRLRLRSPRTPMRRAGCGTSRRNSQARARHRRAPRAAAPQLFFGNCKPADLCQIDQ